MKQAFASRASLQVTAHLCKRVGRQWLAVRRHQRFNILRCPAEGRVEATDAQPLHGRFDHEDDAGFLADQLFPSPARPPCIPLCEHWNGGSRNARVRRAASQGIRASASRYRGGRSSIADVRATLPRGSENMRLHAAHRAASVPARSHPARPRTPQFCDQFACSC